MVRRHRLGSLRSPGSRPHAGPARHIRRSGCDAGGRGRHTGCQSAGSAGIPRLGAGRRRGRAADGRGRTVHRCRPYRLGVGSRALARRYGSGLAGDEQPAPRAVSSHRRSRAFVLLAFHCRYPARAYRRRRREVGPPAIGPAAGTGRQPADDHRHRGRAVVRGLAGRRRSGGVRGGGRAGRGSCARPRRAAFRPQPGGRYASAGSRCASWPAGICGSASRCWRRRPRSSPAACSTTLPCSTTRLQRPAPRDSGGDSASVARCGAALGWRRTGHRAR